MEGESLQALKGSTRWQTFTLSLLAILFVPLATFAQSAPLYTGSWLEPNQFTLAKSFIDRSLRLEMGYGGEFYSSADSIRPMESGASPTHNLGIGLEGLIWSKLEVLSQFRFPVETADYFFGVYSLFYIRSLDPNSPFRLRISHISSHLVDGTPDSVVGGSSSHFSREFITLEKYYRRSLGQLPLSASIGVRYVFHQVTHVEPAFQIPLVVQLGFFPEKPGSTNNLFLTLSSAGDPSGPSYSASLTYRSSFSAKNATDLYVSYLYGPSFEGDYALTKHRTVELGMRLMPQF